MTLSRRKMLGLVGGGVVLAAGSSVGAFVATRTPTRALAPWTAAGGYDDPRLRALSYALLAPNPHNCQPWLAELRGRDSIILTRDPAKNLPHTDPYDRQITIGMGCFIELMVQAAAAEGLRTDLRLFPDGTAPNEPIAVARLSPGATPDPLFEAVMDRRSCKAPMDMTQAITTADIDRALSPLPAKVLGAGTADPTRVAALRALTWDAWMIEAMTERNLAESIDLMRIGKPEIEANPDGIDLGDPMLEVLRRLGMMDRAALMDTTSQGFKQTVNGFRKVFEATPAIVWLTTEDNTRHDQIDAGRAWVRLNLQTTRMGLSLHPVSQALQEYPEMEVARARLHATLAQPGQTVQMLGRLGYGPAIPRTPRWGLEAKLLNA